MKSSLIYTVIRRRKVRFAGHVPLMENEKSYRIPLVE